MPAPKQSFSPLLFCIPLQAAEAAGPAAFVANPRGIIRNSLVGDHYFCRDAMRFIANCDALHRSTAIAANAEILSAEEAIHQERVFNAGRRRVYEALTVERQFDKIIHLSGVMKAAVMAKMQKPTTPSPHPHLR